MKKWIIIGIIIGIIGPLFVFVVHPLLFYFIKRPLFLGCQNILLVIYPFSFCMLDSESLPIGQKLFIYIGSTILNIGLFAFVGYIVGLIVRAITSEVKR